MLPPVFPPLRADNCNIFFVYTPGNRFARHYCLPCRHILHSDIESKVLTSAVWECFIHMFDELGMAVYETVGLVAVEDGEQEVPRDSGRVEAILGLWVIGGQLRQLTCSPLAHGEESDDWQRAERGF